MKTTCFDEGDTLVIRLLDTTIVRGVSQDWRTHISFAADGTVVETVIPEARESGAWPLRVESRQAAWSPAGSCGHQAMSDASAALTAQALTPLPGSVRMLPT